MLVGIDDLSFYTANFYLDLKDLADAHNIDSDKYRQGIWQDQMSMPAPDEDVVTMATNAAKPIIERAGSENICTLMFATETGIDQSKAAGIYVHHLLNLNPNCRVVELKQACYSSTAAIQMACALVAQQPNKKVLVIASDIARYDRNSPGEATQGCGAVAMLIAANPKIMTISPEVGNHTEDVMDFWRPNYRTTALVDGKYSTKIYLKSMKLAWQNFLSASGLSFADFAHFCYHLPFSRMGEKAHKHLAKINGEKLSAEQVKQQIETGIIYNRIIGNTYTASLYIGLASLLENSHQDLSGQRICFFGYGSGCVAEFFCGTLNENYRQFLRTEQHQKMLANRQQVSYAEYLKLYDYPDPKDGGKHSIPKVTTGGYRLAAINDHRREYSSC